MAVLAALWGEVLTVLKAVGGAVPFLLAYVALILALMLIWSFVRRLLRPRHDYGSLKTVTFGDESAVVSNGVASVISIVLIFVLWGAFTGSKLLPGFLHMPGPFQGTATFDYTLTAPDGTTDDATVTVLVHQPDVTVADPEVAPGEGMARNDTIAIGMFRSALLRVADNDEVTREQGAQITAID
ncbi:MAG: ABC transporter permease, partial [Alphaproteobacteria bacterium]|nr:ABC transporter permease [Alphaproteobacteria bacterium]